MDLEESLFQPGLAVLVSNPYGTDSDAYRMGRMVDPKRSARPVFVPCKVIVGAKDGQVVVETEWEPKMKLVKKVEELFPANATQTVDDMVELGHLNDATLLQNVQARYHGERQQIYTMAGPILIAVNPYQIVRDQNGTSIYDEAYITKYKDEPVDIHSGRGSSLGPHVFAVASRAVGTFLEEKQNQSIVISGESGAGKTESTKQIMQFITSCSHARVETTSCGIEKKLLRSNPVLEALGNAKTLRNDNSSRFGKFIRINLEEHGAVASKRGINIVGGSIQDFLLEKSRVVHHVKGERNYHIFYQLIKGCSEKERAQFHLESAKEFRYLNPELQQDLQQELFPEEVARARTYSRSASVAHKEQSKEIEASHASARQIDDQAGFQELEESLRVVGFDETKRAAIFSILSGVLHLGNISFVETGAEKCQVEQSKKNNSLHAAAHLLGLDPEDMAKQLVTRETTTAQQTILSPLDRTRSYMGVDALAKSIYGNLFRWVVEEINHTLAGDAAGQAQGSLGYIGILDIFGFEVFKKNGFEQFCINFANEKLHQLFTTYVFKMEQKIYEQEGIDYSEIRFTDNQAIIDLIEKKPHGVMALLDEACLFPKSTDESFLSKLDSVHGNPSSKNASSLYRKATIKDSHFGPSFIIHHSAASVNYTVTEFLTKNRDRLESNVTAMLLTSSQPLVRDLFQHQGEMDSGRGNFTGSNAFLGSKFKDDINKLMKTLQSTTPHFIRCLKANGEKRPGFMDPELVLHQLQYLGVLDSIRIRHSGFSYRTTYGAFYSRFALVVPSIESPAKLQSRKDYSEALAKDRCKALVNHLWDLVNAAKQNGSKENGSSKSKPPSLTSMIQFGATRIFLRKQMIQSLEALREVRLQSMEKAAAKIQSVMRMVLVHYKADAIRRGFERIRVAWRALKDRQAWVHRWKTQQQTKRVAVIWRAKAELGRRRRALVKVQSFARACVVRAAFLEKKRAAERIARLLRFRLMARAIVLIQGAARSFLVRNRIYWAKVRAAIQVQAAWRGFAFRSSAPRIMQHLDRKREERMLTRAAKGIQTRWQTFLVRRRFKTLVRAAKALQFWANGFVLRERFLAIRASTRTIQRVARGFLARALCRRMVTRRMLEQEMWEINQVRYREIYDIVFYNSRAHEVQQSHDTFEQKMGMDQIVSHGKRAIHAVIDSDVVTDVAPSFPESSLTKAVTSLPDVKCIDQGLSHCVAVTQDGSVYSWGRSDRGQLGHGKFTFQVRPQKIRAFLHPKVTVTYVAAGERHSLALTKHGRVYSWGAGSFGQLGHGDTDNQATPKMVAALSHRHVTSIASGANHCLAVVSTGLLYSWGGPGQVVGHGPFVGVGSQLTPKPLRALAKERIISIGCGRNFSAATTKTGSLYTWGENDFGQLGCGEAKHILQPKRVPLPTAEDAVHVSCGGRHAGVIDAKGKLFMWGSNVFGQVGTGKAKVRQYSRPVRIELRKPVLCLATGWRHTMVLCKGEEAYAWGVTSLPLDEALRIDEEILSSSVDHAPRFDAPSPVLLNLESCGRKVIGLWASKSHTCSLSSILYEQKPATLALSTMPLVGHRSTPISDAFQPPLLPTKICHSPRSFIHNGMAVAEVSSKQQEEQLWQSSRKVVDTKAPSPPAVVVAGSGSRYELDKLSKGELKDLVCSLVQNPSSVKAFLDAELSTTKTSLKVSTGAGVTFSAQVPAPLSTTSPSASLTSSPFAGPHRGRTRASSSALRDTALREAKEEMNDEQLASIRAAQEQRRREQHRRAREGSVVAPESFFSSSLLLRSPPSTHALSSKNSKTHTTINSPSQHSKKPVRQSAIKVTSKTSKLAQNRDTVYSLTTSQKKKMSNLEEKHVEDVEEEKDDDEPIHSRMSKSSTPKNQSISSLLERLECQARLDADAIWEKFS